METKETKNLEKMVKLIGIYNNMPMIPKHLWPEKEKVYINNIKVHRTIDYNILEEQAKKLYSELSKYEIDVFLDGDQDIADKMIAKYNVQELHRFLNAAFSDFLGYQKVRE